MALRSKETALARAQDQFTERMDKIRNALAGADEVDERLPKGLLATACAEWLVTWTAESRDLARSDLIATMDALVQDIVIADCDA
jgi:hypothetical protein